MSHKITSPTYTNLHGLRFASVRLSAMHVQLARQGLQMTKQTSPLRQRMIDDMNFRNMSPNTQKVYTYAIANFSAFHRRPPDKLGIEDVRKYRLHLMGRGLKATSINPIIGALRFFYSVTLGQKDVAEQIPFARKEDTLPAVLTQDEVVRLLKAEAKRCTQRASSSSSPISPA